MAAVTICSDFGAQKIKSATVSTVSPSICHEVMGPDAMFWTQIISLQQILKTKDFYPVHTIHSLGCLKAPNDWALTGQDENIF